MRAPRIQSESDIYHIVARGSGRQLIFEDDGDREEFLSLLRIISRRFRIEVYAWCLMGNHVHLLFRAPIAIISKAMQALLCTYALRYNARTGRSGHLFQDRFRSDPIESDESLLCVLRYIHRNPEKAGIAPHDRYEWSSYAEYLGEADICTTEFVLSLFGSADDYVTFHRFEDEGTYLDLFGSRSATRAMPDEAALRLARDVLGDIPLAAVKSLDKRERNRCIIVLLDAGLSVRQTERLTGISRGIIDHAKNLSKNLTL